MAERREERAKVLITGGTGFIGSYLAMDLLKKGNEVVVADRSYDLRRIEGFKDEFEKNKDRLTFIQGDLSLSEHVHQWFDEFRPQSVYHLGALLSAGAETNPTQGFLTDLQGSWHVLEAARLQRQRKKSGPVKVIFPSTIAAFGAHIPPELKEKVPNEAPQFPTTMYGDAKLSVERLGDYYHRRKWVDFRAVRFPSVIGASRGPGGTTVYSTLMIQQPALSQAYSVYVKEDLRLAILYVKDAVKALTMLHDAEDSKLGSSDNSVRRVYNIGSIKGPDGRPPTAGDVEKTVNKVVGADLIDFKPDAMMDQTVRGFGILDDSKAQKEWGWKGDYTDLSKVVEDFVKEVKDYPGRLQRLELFG